jgi:hypothetical protein
LFSSGSTIEAAWVMLKSEFSDKSGLKFRTKFGTVRTWRVEKDSKMQVVVSRPKGTVENFRMLV